MSSRFPQRTDPRSALFENYNHNPTAPSSNHERKARTSPSPRPGPGAGYGVGVTQGSSVGYYGGAREDLYGNSSAAGGGGGYRPATPNKRGQYSDAVLNELESQNDSEISGILGKVSQLKSMTIAIGDEIRSSSALAEKMNDGFDSTRLRLRGTMNRMLVMAEKTGVGWRVWLGFFLAVGLLFFYVWALR